jgi:hypothetical protein
MMTALQFVMAGVLILNPIIVSLAIAYGIVFVLTRHSIRPFRRKIVIGAIAGFAVYGLLHATQIAPPIEGALTLEDAHS